MPLSCSARVLPDPALTELDPLTGLPTTRVLLRRIGAAKSPFALILFDLDGLKSVNRTHGYAVGDGLLASAAERLSGVPAFQDRVVRLEGDRFAVLLADAADPDELSGLLSGAYGALGRSAAAEEKMPTITMSAGAALWTGPDVAAAELLRRCELALGEARRAGGGCFRLFEERMRPVEAAGSGPAEELARACRRGEWVLQYQPQIREPGRILDGIEGLLRWRHPEKGLLKPAHFLEDLERDESAEEVGRWVIAQACRDLALLRGAGVAVPRVAVNLFANGAGHRTLRDDVARALAGNGLAARDLELEITEGVALDRGSALLSDLAALRASGVQIALDDFGTGFACLATLRDLPVTGLKIDRSFVRDLAPRSTDRAVVRALVALGRELDLRVVAEGVETSAQAAALARLGLKVFQGYRYAPAIGAMEIAARLRPGGRWSLATDRNPGSDLDRNKMSGCADRS